MAMILLCGQPCSGKSTAAAEVVRAIDSFRSERASASDSLPSQARPEANLQIRVLDDSALPATRDEAYTGKSLRINHISVNTTSGRMKAFEHGHSIRVFPLGLRRGEDNALRRKATIMEVLIIYTYESSAP